MAAALNRGKYMKKAKNEPSSVASMPKPKPTLTLDEETLPAIKDWKVGNTYRLVLEVKQKSLEDPEYLEDSKLHARFEVLKVMPHKNSDPDFDGWGDDEEDED